MPSSQSQYHALGVVLWMIQGAWPYQLNLREAHLLWVPVCSVSVSNPSPIPRPSFLSAFCAAECTLTRAKGHFYVGPLSILIRISKALGLSVCLENARGVKGVWENHCQAHTGFWAYWEKCQYRFDQHPSPSVYCLLRFRVEHVTPSTWPRVLQQRGQQEGRGWIATRAVLTSSSPSKAEFSINDLFSVPPWDEDQRANNSSRAMVMFLLIMSNSKERAHFHTTMPVNS